MNDRERIVTEWLARAEHFWILSRVAVHEFGFLFPGMHLHALALELMLKSAILTLDPAGAAYSDLTRRTFREGHDIMQLIERWNGLCPERQITKRINGLLGWEESGCGLELFERSFEALSKYTNPDMISRYFEGKLEWDAWAVDAANAVFFSVRKWVLAFLKVDRDPIDAALEGNCGRTEGAAWLSRALRKSNMALPLEHRLIA